MGKARVRAIIGDEGPLSARDAAVAAVVAAWSGDGYVEDSLRGFRDAGRLDGREGGLAAEIALGTVRRSETIGQVLSRLARLNLHTTPRPVLAILYSGIFQAIWLDRVPEFAIVNEAVDQARRMAGGRAPKLVNAVLRNVCRAIAERRTEWVAGDARRVRVGWAQACRFDQPVLPEPGDAAATQAHAAAATGERPARFRTLVERFGLEQAEAISWAGQATPPTVLQRNALRCSAAQFVAGLQARYGEAVEVGDDAAFLAPAESPVDNPIFAEGGAYVQDSTARRAADLLAAAPGERVLDLCAAPGGKSIALAIAMQDRGVIVACDTAARRLRSLVQNLARLDLYCVQTHELPPRFAAVGRRARATGGPADEAAHRSEPAADPLGTPFDAALLDVPCSNSGVIARRPEARRSLGPGKLRALVELQRMLLLEAGRALKVGGRLVYSTCSIEPEENDAQIEWLLAAQGGRWRVEQQALTLPQWGPRWSDWRDGGFAARLIRQG